MRAKPILAAFLMLAVSACGTASTVVPQTTRFPRVAPPAIQPLTMSPVRFRVLTENEIRAMADSREPIVLFALDDENYRNLSLNLIEVRRYIEEQRGATVFLQRVLDERSEPIPPEPVSR